MSRLELARLIFGAGFVATFVGVPLMLGLGLYITITRVVLVQRGWR